jgi:threonine dehydrogenase-like Zn-dependent dehydrogenase
MNIVVNRPDKSCDVLVIGAGPYGLGFSALAELQTFECRLCGLTVTEATDDEALDAAIPLAPR